MGAAASYQAAFDGKVVEEEYQSAVQKERLPAVFTDGVPTSWATHLWTSKTKDRVFVFIGLSYDMAHPSAATVTVTVTDANNKSFVVPLQSKFADGSSGSAVFQQEAVRITREQMSPHLWKLTIRQSGSELYDNGTKVVNGPSWM